MDDIKLKETFAALTKSGNRDALAEFFVEFIQPNHIIPDFVSMLLNSRSLKEGDVLVKKIRKGIKVHTLVPGSIHLKSEITVRERANFVLDGANVEVTYNEWELESGEIGTVADIRKEMMEQLRDYYQNKVFTALTTVWTAINTPSNFVSAGGAVTATLLKNAIDYVNQTVGKVRAVVGVRSILTPITTFGAFWADPGDTLHRVNSQLEEVMRTGWLGTYYGAPIIALNQVWDNPEDYNALLPTDKILIIGENVGEFITYGESRFAQYSDPRPTPPQWVLKLYQRFGLMIDKANGIYVIGNIS